MIAFLNPEGFLNVLEKCTSVAVNLEGGIFIVYMYSKSLSSSLSLPVVWGVPSWVRYFRFLVGGYFVYSIFYDIVLIVLVDIVGLTEV